MEEKRNQNKESNVTEKHHSENEFNEFNIRTSNSFIMNERGIRRQIRDWLEENPYQELLSYMRSRVMGQEDIAIVVANIYNYLTNVSNPGVNNYETRGNCNNMILAAPSGSGKTETYRALKDYFRSRIPALKLEITDVSNLTATGYRGSDPSSIVEAFVRCGTEPIGIVFMDEFDKVCIPSYTANYGNVHMELQHNLLTLVEGSTVQAKRGCVNTNNLLFIAMGSFDQFRKKREKENKEPIGFGTEGSVESTGSGHEAPITRENMIAAGGCYELIGRFSYIINYQKLNRRTILNIIEKACEDIADQFHCDIELGEAALDELCESSDSKFGCRLIESKIREVVLKAYSRAMEEKDKWDVLDLKIDSLASYTYAFREYTEEEKALEAAFQPEDPGSENEL